MRILIYGAGTIGLIYGWLLSRKHEVSVLIKPEKSAVVNKGYSLILHDLRTKTARDASLEYWPDTVLDSNGIYDAILVTVNSCQLKSVLPFLQNNSADIIFMQNNWDIQRDISPYLSPEQYLIGFPSQVGGGRDGNRIEVNIYKEGTILGEADGKISKKLIKYKHAFESAGITVEMKADILDWLKVHYLQQSISAGAILKAGNYHAFSKSYKAVEEMVYAFREGIAVCSACGIDTSKIFPANMFNKPAPLVALIMKSMFNKPATVTMVTGHMKQGLIEWVDGIIKY